MSGMWERLGGLQSVNARETGAVFDLPWCHPEISPSQLPTLQKFVGR